MPKAKKLYVIIVDGVLNTNIYTSLLDVSGDTGVPYRTLWRRLKECGCYNKKGILVQPCDLVKVKGRGSIK